MKTIALEEHFVTADFLKATGAYGHSVPEPMRAIRDKLLDLGDARIAAMDDGGITLQVLSLAAMGIDDLAPANQTAVFHDVNDELAAAVQAHLDRFAAFATPALKEPAAAVKELERCIRDLGFKGLYVNGTTEGKFLDAPEFFPLLEAAEALNVPLYLDPAPPPAVVQSAYYSDLPGDTGMLLSIAGWGWHAELGLHLLRLIVSGVFDRLPNLQVIVGHMGEGVPYALARSNGILSAAAKNLKRSVTETILAQVHITTSGYFTRPPFDCARQVLGLDHLMYSVDYPFSPNTRGRDFLATLQSEPALSTAEMEALTHGNAKRLLRL
ncbi:amidohydrolase family protein [Granulicella sp. L46]|uniref:amidohydrolase family protein n=1 Tax=Granulicella sp. L46 TaxID=1641865 RepID=UPI00131E29E1|nr:amidohydrolase family protein [Granulicella sp. L46]